METDWYSEYIAKQCELGVKREEAYVESQIRKNRKWHSFYYFLRFLLTGKD